jgi:hypothetical protein
MKNIDAAILPFVLLIIVGLVLPFPVSALSLNCTMTSNTTMTCDEIGNATDTHLGSMDSAITNMSLNYSTAIANLVQCRYERDYFDNKSVKYDQLVLSFQLCRETLDICKSDVGNTSTALTSMSIARASENANWQNYCMFAVAIGLGIGWVMWKRSKAAEGLEERSPRRMKGE